MKICADENVSWRLVSIINELSSNSVRLLHVADIDAKGVKDRIWVRTFAEDGGEAIISADSAMTRRPAELIAISEAGIKLVVLPANYEKAKIPQQTAYMLMWWSKILEIVQQGNRGSYVKLPWNMPLLKVPAWQKIDIQAARQKWKRSTRPSRRSGRTG